MTVRYERLIGYQLIARMTTANCALQDVSFFLRDMDPLTWEPLKYIPKVDTELGYAEGAKELRADEDHIKEKTLESCNIANRQSLIVDEFVKRYESISDIENGLALFQTSKTSLDSDIADVKTHRSNVVQS